MKSRYHRTRANDFMTGSQYIYNMVDAHRCTIDVRRGKNFYACTDQQGPVSIAGVSG